MNARVERLDEPEPGLLSITVREDGKNEALVLCTLPGALAIGLVPDRPRGRAATPAITKLRRHLEGAVVAAIARSNRCIVLELTRGGAVRRLIASARKPHGAWWLSDAQGAVVIQSAGAQPISLDEHEHLRTLERPALVETGQAVLDMHRAARTGQAQRGIDKVRKRLRRKRQAIEADLARARRANELHEQASLILAHASEIPPNSSVFEVESWDPPPRVIRLDLDPSKSAPEMANALFKRAKRLRRGLDVAPGRLSLVDEQLGELDALTRQLEAGELEPVFAALAALGDPGAQLTERTTSPARSRGRLPYRHFASAEGNAILVGRNAADNDRLTLRVARPHDLWLHARGVTGAHVVVPLDKGKTCASDTLVDAATLAAHFSDLRGEGTVDVLYTPRRFVHKRRGAAVGAVTLDREKVIAVRLEENRLARLLATERRA